MSSEITKRIVKSSKPKSGTKIEGSIGIELTDKYGNVKYKKELKNTTTNYLSDVMRCITISQTLSEVFQLGFYRWISFMTALRQVGGGCVLFDRPFYDDEENPTVPTVDPAKAIRHDFYECMVGIAGDTPKAVSGDGPRGEIVSANVIEIKDENDPTKVIGQQWGWIWPVGEGTGTVKSLGLMQGRPAQCTVWGSSSYESANIYTRPTISRWLTRWITQDTQFWLRAAESYMNITAGTIQSTQLTIMAANVNPDNTFTILFSALESGSAYCGVYLVTLSQMQDMTWVSRPWYDSKNVILWAQQIIRFQNQSSGTGAFLPHLWSYDPAKKQAKYSCIHSVSGANVTVKLHWLDFTDLLKQPEWWKGTNYEANSPAAAGRMPALGSAETLQTFTVPTASQGNPDGRIMTPNSWPTVMGWTAQTYNPSYGSDDLYRAAIVGFTDKYLWLVGSGYTSTSPYASEILFCRIDRTTNEFWVKEVWRGSGTSGYQHFWTNFTIRSLSYIGGAVFFYNNLSVDVENIGIARWVGEPNNIWEIDAVTQSSHTISNDYPTDTSTSPGLLFIGCPTGKSCASLPFTCQISKFTSNKETNSISRNAFAINSPYLIPTLTDASALAWHGFGRSGSSSTINTLTNLDVFQNNECNVSSNYIPGLAAVMHPWTLIAKRNLDPEDYIEKEDEDILNVKWRVVERGE